MLGSGCCCPEPCRRPAGWAPRLHPGPDTRDSPAPWVSPRFACPPRRLRGAEGQGPPDPLPRVQATAAARPPPASGGSCRLPGVSGPDQRIPRPSLRCHLPALFSFFSNQRAPPNSFSSLLRRGTTQRRFLQLLRLESEITDLLNANAAGLHFCAPKRVLPHHLPH